MYAVLLWGIACWLRYGTKPTKDGEAAPAAGGAVGIDTAVVRGFFQKVSGFIGAGLVPLAVGLWAYPRRRRLLYAGLIAAVQQGQKYPER